jgi:hypothetical protein
VSLRALGVLILSTLAAYPELAAQEVEPAAVEVDAATLTRRADLVGKEIVVDDRVNRIQNHPSNGEQIFDQIFVKRAPDLAFELPPGLRRRQSPQATSARIRGVLRRDGDRWWCEVRSVDYMPSDLDRLIRGVALLARTDTDGRTAWIRWAEKRGQQYKDDALLKKASELEAEVIRVDAERPSRDPASHLLSLAARAREHNVAEPEPSALAHRGFRTALTSARSTKELKALRARVEEFLPGAASVPASSPDLTRRDQAYRIDPADAYRTAPPDARAALDHRLWADVTQQYLERAAVEDPKSLMTLSEEAARLLPDRPALARRLLEQGVTAAAADVGSLRQSEVEALAKHYRESLQEPEKAKALVRSWLDEQRNRRLSPRDAEGRLALAEQYEAMLGDRAAAASLLREASRIDPSSREVSAAFRRRGFRKVGDEWVEPAKSPEKATRGDTDATERAEAATAGGDTPPDDASQTPSTAIQGVRSDSLRNATPRQVLARLNGKPNRKVFVASQGQMLEQWIYVLPRQNQYVNFLHKPGDPQPRVISYYSLPRSPSDPPAGP